MTNRIYVVTDTTAEGETRHRMVRAATPAQARNHVARQQYSVAVATPDESIELTKLGIEVENAGDVPL